MRQNRADAPCVLIVSDNDETIDGLQEYLRRAGVGSRGVRQLDGLVWGRLTFEVVVLFPDDFRPDDVIEAVTRLVRVRPETLAVLVTRAPRQFSPLAEAKGGATAPVILTKPAWGWTILEAVRARLGGLA